MVVSAKAYDLADAIDATLVWMDDAPLAVVRVVLDSPSHELFRLQALGGALKAAQSLRRASGVALQDWDPEG